jgi:hypothetical protein
MDPASNNRPTRNQFVIGPGFIDRPDWNRIQLADSLCLSVHRDLPVCRDEGQDVQLTLLGFMLDWSNPTRSDADILRELSRFGGDFDACRRATAELGGRWVLMLRSKSSSVLFHDASGLRQVCFTTGSKVWCATQPGLLIDIAGLRPDDEALAFFAEHKLQCAESWWPGDESGFCGLQVLLPNHALDLVKGRPFRYWPDAPLESMDSALVLERAAARLTGVIQAAVHRDDIALGLSAGWDSRILLAASRPVIDRISIYNGCGAALSDSHPDVAIPRRLARRFGFDLDLVPEPSQADPVFAKQFMEHAWQAHPGYAIGMQADYACYSGDKVAAIGNVSEIGKLPYRGKLTNGQPVDGAFLAGFYWGGHNHAAQALDRWLGDADDSKGYHILDLFYWEQRLGRWLAANFVEFDFAWRDILAPFNIRALMADLLACDEADRRPPTHSLYRELIDSLWPELLAEPINPRPAVPRSRKLRRWLRQRLARLRRLPLSD